MDTRRSYYLARRQDDFAEARWTPPTDPVALSYESQNLGKTFSA